jgi:hypothetical protein
VCTALGVKLVAHAWFDSRQNRVDASPARGPPLWDDSDVPVGERTQVEPDWDLAAQPAPDYEVDQRINW